MVLEHRVGQAAVPLWGDVPCETEALAGVEVRGELLWALARACAAVLPAAYRVGLPRLAGVEPLGWYPADRLAAMLALVERRFRAARPIKELLGAELARQWLAQAPLPVHTPAELLRQHAGSTDYLQRVRGPERRVGAFTLEWLEEAEGRALVRSTTPFDKDLERGLLLGALEHFPALSFADVDDSETPGLFQLEFH